MRAAVICLVVLSALHAGAAAATEPEGGGSGAQATRPEFAQFLRDISRLNSTCADLAELERIAKTVGPGAAKLYVDKAAERRKEQLADTKAAMTDFVSTSHSWTTQHFAEIERPDGAVDLGSGFVTPAQTIAQLKAKIEAVRCYDPAWATKVVGALDGIASGVESMIADEKRCRAQPLCMGARLAPSVCEAIASKRDYLAQIAIERKNPSGVVDLRRLHDLGEMAQSADDAIADGKKRYAAVAKKPFSEAVLCK